MTDHSLARTETNNSQDEPPYEIFICYRRSSSACYALQLYRELVEAFGEVIFIDHECLAGGELWRSRIDDVIRHVNTVIVLIGAGWLDVLNQRVEEGSDEVVRELGLALKYRKAVFPLLLDGMQMPASDGQILAETGAAVDRILQALSELHARPLRASDFPNDIYVIVSELSKRLTRFPGRFRHRCHQALGEMLEGRSGVQRLGTKFIPLREAILRRSIQNKLDEALARRPALLVIHAEEGMGKTIALGWALKSLREEAVLLTDSRELLWRDSFAQGLKKLLRRHCSKAEAPLAKTIPMVVAIDGLNEASSVPWGERLQEMLDRYDDNPKIRVIVTVRSGYWQTSIAPALRHGGIELLNVPPLDDPEFIALSEKLGFAWKELNADVYDQLRRPRMLVAASSISPEELNGKELSYPLLQLLDLKRRDGDYRRLCFEHFERVLCELGRAAKGRREGLSRRAMRDLLGDLSDSAFEEGLRELCDAGVLRRSPGKFAVHEGATNVALALHLLQSLCQLNINDHATLGEWIRTELADQQDASTARIITGAITAIVCERIKGERPDLDNHDPVLAALLADWLGRYNADDGPVRQARWLVPEIVWLAENTRYRDLEVLLAQVLSEEPNSPWQAEFLNKLGQWLLYVEPEADSGRTARAGRPDFDECLSQALTIAPLRSVGRGKARLRRFGLEVAAKAALAPSTVPLLGPVLSVAVQPEGGWDRMRCWVSTADADWWIELEPIWNRISQEFADSPLCEAVGRLLRYLWPTPECLAAIPAQPTPDPDPRMRFVDLAQLSYLSQPGAQPSEEQMDTLLKRTEPKRAPRQVVREHAAALALWVPDQFQQAVDQWAQQSTGDAEDRAPFEGAALAEFAPFVSSAHARSLRAAIPIRTDLEGSQLDYLRLVSWWSLPPARRVAAVIRHLRFFDLDSKVLGAATLDASSASALVRRLVREGSPVASRIAFWLFWAFTGDNSDSPRNALQDALPQIDTEKLGVAGQYWLLRLGLKLEVPNLSTTMVPKGWCYTPDEDQYIQLNYARSAALAATGDLSDSDMRERCHPDHWHLGSRSDRAGLISERASKLYEQFIEDSYPPFARGVDEVRMQEMVERHPHIVDQVLSSVDRWRDIRAEELAKTLSPTEHPRWIELIETFTHPQRKIKWIVNGINQRMLLVFQAPDTERARSIWDWMLETVEHDADLIQLVVTAKKGNGLNWLQECSKLNTSATPHRQLRAATLAAITQDPHQRFVVEGACKEHAGWIREGFNRALELYQADELAKAWYRRFRTATDWKQAYGCWRMHLEHIDLRSRFWDQDSFPAYALPDADRYEHTFKYMIDQAIGRRSEKLKKTRFGTELIKN